VHDDMNVLAFGANIISLETALETLAAFLQAEPSSEERYLRRTAKVADIEEEQS
jgi:ribose 5-phosphate isomerase RpiB